MVTKRVRLLQNIYRFHMEHLKTKQVYDKDFTKLAKIVRDLNLRIKRSQRKKVVITQLAMVDEFECSFIGPRSKKLRKDTVTATSTRNARKILREIYGRKIKIKTVKKK